MIAGIFPSIFQNSKPAFLNTKMSDLRSNRNHKGIFMILVQYILAAVFMSSMFLVIGQIDFMLKKDPGFKPENILQIELDKQLGESTDYLKKRTLQVDGVEKLAFSDTWIGEGFGKKPTGEKGKEILCNFFSIDPDYCDLMGITIKQGRDYSWLNPTDTLSAILRDTRQCFLRRWNWLRRAA